LTIRVHNTLSGRKEEFIPAEASRVRIYVCGVTPYSDTHIGHARPSVLWDVVRRYLEYRGYQVTVVQNFTDVDDKVIARARAQDRDPLELSGAFSDEYIGLMDRLGVRRADSYPKVSDHMDEIVEVIAGLIDKGAGYVQDGNVFFDVGGFPGYGKLSHRSIDELKAGARVEVDETKRHPADFALWKRAKPGEPSWPSPWGPGRPGWHIECTAMALKYLGSGFDLHGGGTELVFPHHENEIAQAEAYTGQAPFCRYWLHHEMVNIRGEKMSKSLDNFVTVREILERAPAGAVRLLLLGAHYRKAVEFDFDLLAENTRAWRRIRDSAERLREAAVELGSEPGSGGPAEGEPSSLVRAAAEARTRFEEAMDDDFNTAAALAAIFDLVRQVNAQLAGGTTGRLDSDGATAALAVLDDLAGGVLGLFDGEAGSGEPGETRAEAASLLNLLVEVRGKLRSERHYALADFVRDALLDLGYEIQDSDQGSVAKRRE
jgi:cysteinyl-tRNA synthetase